MKYNLRRLKLYVYLVDIIVLVIIIISHMNIFGYTKKVIEDGTMLPTYNVGDLVYSYNKPYNELCLGDVVLFKVHDVVLCRRLIDYIDNSFIIKADAVPTEDTLVVDSENYIGVIKYCIPRGKVLLSLIDSIGFKMLVAILVILTFVI